MLKLSTSMRTHLCVVSFFLLLTPAALATSEDFKSYWYQGKAEITSYTLEQARYGEIHSGDAVLVFVTEDFSRAKQVKLDNPRAAGDDAVSVLKLNLTKNFTTGVYPYSMMTSVFTPVNSDEALFPLKVTTTSQEWCGHTFTQLNRTDAGFRVREFSYFESEGDRDEQLTGATTEDGLWTLLRIDPAALPTGELRLIPSSMYQRLRHQPWVARQAVARLAADPKNAEQMVYSLKYPELDRELRISFQKAAPHEIEAWEETYGGLTTRAVKKKRILLDYWSRNSVQDATFRKQLGLD